MTGTLQDLRYALRALRRAPGFTAVSIATVALGIAATTVVYSIVDGILLRPLPIADPDRIILARELNPAGQDMSVSQPNFEDWKARQTSFEKFAAWRGLTVNLTGVEQPRRVYARIVTWELLSTLGVTPVLGRDFTAADDTYGAPLTVIVSYAFWQRELGGATSAIGATIHLFETPVTVIGVLPKDFTIARQEDIFMPYYANIDPRDTSHSNRGNHTGLAAIARLKPGVSVETARAEIASITRQLELEYPNTNSGNGSTVQPLFETLVGPARSMLYVLLGSVLTMLLIACVNLANLMLSRAAGRAQEMAVRRSLGAARWRLARQMLTESVLLAIIGGVAGVALAYAGFNTVIALLPPNQPRVHVVAINWRVLFAAAAASIGTGVLFGLVPALQAATGRSMTLLRSTRVTGAAHASNATRRVLMLSEVALALILVTSAGLMLRTINNLIAVDTGVTRDQIITAQFNLPQRYDRPRRVLFFNEALAKIRAIPGVTAASITYSLPVAGSNWNSIFIIEGQGIPERSKLPSSAWIPVENQYFSTMGMHLLRGRAFDQRDTPTSPEVVIVSETFAKRFFGNDNPIGTRVKQGWPEDNNPWREIVGVVNDVRLNDLQGAMTLQAYVPTQQMGQSANAFVVRASTDAAAIGRAVEAAVHDLDRNLPVYNIQTMTDIVDASIGNERLTTAFLFGFAALALLMAAIGVYGVTAYSVTQRTHEFGLRMALGADASSVVALVLKQELAACLVGICAGLIGALFVTRLLESLLFGVTARDSSTLIAASGVLAVVTALACVFPARRATRVDPAVALRMD